MGLSASQARLLSITARLSDNELHSQQIANSKVRLADQTQAASREYIDALNTTKLMYTTYDAKGNATQVNLTPSVMYDYSELKNQYGISNTSGQLLVSGTDAKNFAESATMADFVQKYGVELTDNPAYATTLQMIYGMGYDEYFDTTTNLPKVNFGGLNVPTWVGQPHQGMNETAYNNWANQVQLITVYGRESGSYGDLIRQITNVPKYPGDEPLKPEPPNPDDYATLSDFAATIKNHSCYGYTYSRGCNCYMHVLADMLGVGTHVTSSGVSYDIVNTGGWNWNYAAHDTMTGLQEVKDIIKMTPSEDGTGRTIYQRIVDFLWDAHTDYNPNGDDSSFGGPNTPGNLAIFESIIHDLENSPTSEYDKALEEYNEALEQWKKDHEEWVNKWTEIKAWSNAGQELYEIYKEDLENLPIPKIPDEDDAKTQWYINLWHRMNGESEFKSREGNIGTYYKELEDNLYNSPDWLKFALEQGIVALEHVQFVEEAEDGTGLKNSKWQLTMHSACVDITSTEDEVAIAKAEAEYTRKLNDIEAKDKKYDTDLKKLDTEHNALQTEYDSVKSVIEKNVDRSFKAFS